MTNFRKIQESNEWNLKFFKETKNFRSLKSQKKYLQFSVFWNTAQNELEKFIILKHYLKGTEIRS
jgi:hypothetical protein